MLKVIVVLMLFCSGMLCAQQKPDPDWVSQKFSMFIHWGLYSELGGVWEDKPVTRGYSEQIQSFAGIFSDWYARVAQRFNPVNWDADAIVRLAKDAGMKSIVFTSKHHDGFCMYHSKYTDFNVVDATPFKRDVMKELSEACQRHGIKFAVYYSLIDWHFPEAYPISSHNADPVTPGHHIYSMKQVEEIMTNYGPISEIWFDMGSLRGEQSAELYELVTRLQPQCMVSGRLGNDRGDFAVMADNAYPEDKIGVPWQTPASFFDETWSYRSWQERGDVSDKIEEKIRSLVKVVSRGGNYLLNIGPRGDGSVVEFEKEVLLAMGKWLGKYGQGLYGTEASPFSRAFPWGDVTQKGNHLFLFIDSLPDDRKIVLPGVSGRVNRCFSVAGNNTLSWERANGELRLYFPEDIQTDNGLIVADLVFEEIPRITPEVILNTRLLTASNAIPVYAYSSMDYYSRFQSVVGYTWCFNRSSSVITPHIRYTAGDRNKMLRLNLDGVVREVLLEGGKAERLKNNPASIRWTESYWLAPESGRFGPAAIGEGRPVDPKEPGKEWVFVENFTPGEVYRIAVKEKQSVHCLHEIESDRAQPYLISVGKADGLQLILNGETLIKRTYTGAYPLQNEIVELPLRKGKNQLVVKLHNRYGDTIEYVLDRNIPQEVYKLRLEPFQLKSGKVHDCHLELAHPANKNSDIGLRDIQLIL